MVFMKIIVRYDVIRAVDTAVLYYRADRYAVGNVRVKRDGIAVNIGYICSEIKLIILRVAEYRLVSDFKRRGVCIKSQLVFACQLAYGADVVVNVQRVVAHERKVASAYLKISVCVCDMKRVGCCRNAFCVIGIFKSYRAVKKLKT